MFSSPAFIITLIRHGETDENVNGIIQGQSDTKLNDTGILQAKLLAANFPIHGFSLIYSSDLSRAYDTCKELLGVSPDSTGLTEDLIITDARLRERSFGVLQGEPMDKLIRMAKRAGKQVSEFTPEGGETVADIRARILDFIENRLIKDVQSSVSGSSGASASSPKVLLVSHGGVIREIISYFASFGHKSFAGQKKIRHIPPNTSVNEFLVRYSPVHKPAISTVECTRLHELSHLDERLHRQAMAQKQVNDKNGPGF